MSPASEHAVPRTVAELMAQAHALECAAVERYCELADVMETHNNREVAALFRFLADQETTHAQAILERMGWTQAPSAPRSDPVPQPPALEAAHYLMHPWHALQIALALEQQAQAYYSELATRCEDAALRRAAQQMQEEEREHVALLQDWLHKVPRPPDDWAEDPDPPRYTD